MSIVLKVENLSKQYRLGSVGTGSLAHDVNRTWHRLRGKEDPYFKIGEENDRSIKGSSDYVWALRDINLDVKHGEVLGIIGRNGAGKSTLLKILSRTTSPTTGSVKIKGRVASLLEVGTGFHPELSGRENIFLNGAILGMTRQEIKRKFDEIVDFAGVERYIDTPVKRYSSGMYVRLAFGVAAHLEPDILIVDEVLAVGDAEFQKKALGKIDSVSKEGRTVIFVSHQMGTVAQLCQTAILLHNGALIKKDDTNRIINLYTQSQSNSSHYILKPTQKDVGNVDAYFLYQKVTDTNGNAVSEITSMDPIILEMKIFIQSWHPEMELSLSLQHRIKGRVFTIDFPLKDFRNDTSNEILLKLIVPPNLILPNQYSWVSSIFVRGLNMLDVLWDECNFHIHDAGTEFATYEGVDHGVFKLTNYRIEVG